MGPVQYTWGIAIYNTKLRLCIVTKSIVKNLLKCVKKESENNNKGQAECPEHHHLPDLPKTTQSEQT